MKFIILAILLSVCFATLDDLLEEDDLSIFDLIYNLFTGGSSGDYRSFLTKRYDTCEDTWAEQMGGSGSARGGCQGNLCPLPNTQSSNMAGFRNEYNYCVDECNKIKQQRASINGGCVTNIATKYPEAFFGANWQSMATSSMNGVCKPKCQNLRQTGSGGTEICNGGCLGAIANLRYDYIKLNSNLYGHAETGHTMEYKLGNQGEAHCPAGFSPITDGPTACTAALAALNIPGIGGTQGNNPCFKDASGNGHNNGSNGAGASLVCENDSKRHKWVKLSHMSCQGCAADQCRDRYNLNDALEACRVDQTCNSVRCPSGRTSGCTKTSNSPKKLRYGPEDCYRPGPSNGIGVQAEWDHCNNLCKKDYFRLFFECRGACAGTVIARYQTVFYD